MKRIILFVVIIAIALVGIVTCPQKDAHTDALMKLINVALDSELARHADTEEEMGLARLCVRFGHCRDCYRQEIISRQLFCLQHWKNCF